MTTMHALPEQGQTSPGTSERGTTRRLQALTAIGYSLADLAEMLAMPLEHVRALSGARAHRISPDTARAVAELYERLCMTPVGGPDADLARRYARRRGWVPPLAWDDIDDDRGPADVEVARHAAAAVLLENVRWLVDQGASPAEVIYATRRSAATIATYATRAGDPNLARLFTAERKKAAA